MITLLNATNRPDNKTSIISKTYQQFLISSEAPFQYLSLEEINAPLLIQQSIGQRHAEITDLIERYVSKSDKLMIVMPEYNGSFPGILKLFIDAMPHKALEGKKIALTGVATGRGGNLRGMDHLTGILHYLNAHVMPYKLPISGISAFIKDGKISDETVLRDIQKQVSQFLAY
jgi:NAD(P)H-dependent FMN reductase